MNDMAEYIERDKVLAKMQLACRIALLDGDPEQVDVDFSDDFAVAVDDIVEIQAADVAPVVRCKDCKVPHNRWTGCPKLNGLIPPPDFYCAYGERKDGGGDG